MQKELDKIVESLNKTRSWEVISTIEHVSGVEMPKLEQRIEFLETNMANMSFDELLYKLAGMMWY